MSDSSEAQQSNSKIYLEVKMDKNGTIFKNKGKHN